MEIWNQTELRSDAGQTTSLQHRINSLECKMKLTELSRKALGSWQEMNVNTTPSPMPST